MIHSSGAAAVAALLGYNGAFAFTSSLGLSQSFGSRCIPSLSGSMRAVSSLRSMGGERRRVVLKATEDESEDILESYKRQMAEFMVQSHEKRLEAMDAVKAEVQRGYEEHIAELRAQLARLPSTSASPPASAAVAVTAGPKHVEEVAVAASASGAANQLERLDAVNRHPAYAARTGRPGWEARWGAEEAERVGTVSSSAAVKAVVSDTASLPLVEAASTGSASHPGYAARLERPGWAERWGGEEVTRVEASRAVSLAGASQVPADNEHPAYSARLQRPGWNTRWGAEEYERVTSGAAGVIATEGAAAGVATAGGLEAQAAAGVATAEGLEAQAAAGVATAGGLEAQAAAGEVNEDVSPTQDEYLDWSLPEDVPELKEMLVSSRRHFQEYLIRALEASNELRAFKTALEKDLESTKAELSKVEELQGTAGSTSNSQDAIGSGLADNATDGKSQDVELKSQVASLTEEVAHLQRFAQEYMVKAASEKLKAVEEAKASARQESSDRIAALQAQILALQAQG